MSENLSARESTRQALLDNNLTLTVVAAQNKNQPVFDMLWLVTAAARTGYGK